MPRNRIEKTDWRLNMRLPILLLSMAFAAGCSHGIGSATTNSVSQSGAPAVGTPTIKSPTISSIGPNSGAISIYPYPTITGTNFEVGAKVLVNGIAARGVWGDKGGGHYLVFQPPNVSTVGTVDVEVINPDGGMATLKNGWTYLSTTNSGTGTGSGSGSSTGAYSPNFPRLGGVYIGGPQKYDSAFQTFAAKLNMVLIGGDWEGWGGDIHYTKEQVISSIKAQSKVGTKVFQYCLLNGSMAPSNHPRYPDFANEVNLMGWWLFDKGTSGSIEVAGDGTDYTNFTFNAPVDPTTKLGPYQWGAKFIDDYNRLGKYQSHYPNAAATPDLDGYFLDNVFTYPSTSGDWLRNGSTQNPMDPTVDKDLMVGEASFAQYIHKVWPSAIMIGNIGDSIGSGVDKGVDVTPLKNQFQGGILEAAIGENWSIDSWGGSSHMMQWYENSMNILASPQMEMFNVHNVTADGRIPVSYSGGNPTAYTAPYQGFRYSFAAALMNNGYYAATFDAGTYADSSSNYLWFDEFDGGGRGEGYLGQPMNNSTGVPQTTAWQHGVWKREFQNGIVLWNPRGNGKQTVSLSGLGNLKHICGKQDPTVNNCQSVTNGSVTLQDEDGLILLRY